MRHSFILMLLIAIALHPAESSGQHRVIQSEVDGVPLVRSEGGPKYDGPLFEIRSDLVLGIDGGEPEWQQFAAPPASFVVASEGTMVLADSRRFEIFIVSSDGELIARVGGPGSGPGEFFMIGFLFWSERDREFWVMDLRLLRMTRYSLEGELLDTVNYGEMTNRVWDLIIPLFSRCRAFDEILIDR